MIIRTPNQRHLHNEYHTKGTVNMHINPQKAAILKSKSPSIRLNYQSPPIISKHTSNYVNHLLPHQSQLVEPVPKSPTSDLQVHYSSTAQHFFPGTKGSRPSRSNSGILKSHNIISTPSMCSVITRSRENSLSHNKISTKR